MFTFENLFASPFFRKTIVSAIGVITLNLFLHFLRNIAENKIQQPDLRRRTRKGLIVLGYLLSIIFVLGVFSEHLGEFTLSLGIISAGVAFALQELITSIAGWIAISLQHFYKIGDRVQLGGIQGDVIEIGMLRTTIMEIGDWVKGDMYNGRIVRIANSFVFKEPVFNYSAGFPFVWDEVIIPVKYGSDYQLAQTLIMQAIEGNVEIFIPKAEKDWEQLSKKYVVSESAIKPTVLLTANDNWMEFTGRYIVHYQKRRSIKTQIFSQIVKLFEETDEKVEIASATVHLVAAPDFKVKMLDRD